MGREQLFRVTLISIVYLFNVFAAESLACTTIIAGKKATTNGAIIVARNSDSGKAVNSKHLIVHQSRINLPDAVFRSNSNDFSYPLTEVS
jgi:dipeptidase